MKARTSPPLGGVVRLLSLLILWFVMGARAADFATLEPFIQQELKRNNVPGCAVAIVEGKEVVFAKGFGVANLDTGEPVRTDMLFRLGSTTKMFTAATVVSLVQDKKLKLDAPVGDYVKGLAPKIARTTLHQLMTHTAGLADLNQMEGSHDESALGTHARTLNDAAIFTEPGAIYSYANPGFWIAGLAAEEVADKRYADLVAEHVLQPCGMKRSCFRPTEAMTWPVAVGHGPEGTGRATVIRPMGDFAGAWPAGQMFSSAPEFARFCIAFINDGQIDGKQALSPYVIEKLSQPYVTLPAGDRQYGYGLGVKDENGLRWVSHTGSRTGYGSGMRMCPEKKFAVIILCNKTGANLGRVADKAVELALGIPMPKREPVKTLPLAAKDAARYAGVYTQGRALVPLTVRNGKLMAPLGEVKRVGENRFQLPAGEGSAGDATDILMVPGADGRAEYLIRNGRALKRVE